MLAKLRERNLIKEYNHQFLNLFVIERQRYKKKKKHKNNFITPKLSYQIVIGRQRNPVNEASKTDRPPTYTFVPLTAKLNRVTATRHRHVDGAERAEITPPE